ncbi:hypothetical protein LXA43DRAFT_459927 [Ganoderma leucocontextum]|nr:hypothetical protein LXA43DRAFT_459927 [Ganoderma leucocontextum]
MDIRICKILIAWSGPSTRAPSGLRRTCHLRMQRVCLARRTLVRRFPRQLSRTHIGHLRSSKRHFHIFRDANQDPDFLRRSKNHNSITTCGNTSSGIEGQGTFADELCRSYCHPFNDCFMEHEGFAVTCNSSGNLSRCSGFSSRRPTYQRGGSGESRIAQFVEPLPSSRNPPSDPDLQASCDPSEFARLLPSPAHRPQVQMCPHGNATGQLC